MVWALVFLGSTASSPWRPSPANVTGSSFRAVVAQPSPSGASRTARPERLSFAIIRLLIAFNRNIAITSNFKHAGLRWDLDILRRFDYSTVAVWLVVVQTGGIARHLFLGLHVEDLVQSNLLRLPARFRFRPARRRFDVLLLGHLSCHYAICQGDNATDYDQRWRNAFQQNDHVVSTAPEADGGVDCDAHFVAGLALFDGLDAVRRRQSHRTVRPTG